MKHLKKSLAYLGTYYADHFQELLDSLAAVSAARNAFLDRPQGATPNELARLEGELERAKYREHDAAFSLGSVLRLALESAEKDSATRAKKARRRSSTSNATAQDVHERVAP